MLIEYLLNIYATRFWYYVCAGHLAEIDYWYELLCHIIPAPPNEKGIIFLYFLTLISVGINFYKPLTFDLIGQSKSQAILTFHNDYKMDKTYKITLPRGKSSSVPLLRSLRLVLLLPLFSFLFLFPPPTSLTFSAALDVSVLHFPFLKSLTMYWWYS